MHRRRTILTLKEKMHIIQCIEIGQKQIDLVKKYNSNAATVSSIWKLREEIKHAFINRPGNVQKIKNSKYQEIDDALLAWFKIQRGRNIPVDGPLLRDKATSIGRDFGMDGFVCSNSWITRFKSRHSITYGSIQGEAKTVNKDVVAAWLTEQWPLLRCGYSDRNIFNADETGIFFKVTPNKTHKFKGETCTGGKLSKERITVLFCASMAGEKRQPLIIGKSKNPRCFKNKDLRYHKYTSNAKAWMTSNIFTNELMEWDSELRRNNNRKILLLVDNCPAHPNLNDSLSQIKLVFLPPNTTSILQPLDQGVIRNFKVYYRKSLISKMILAADNNEEFKISIMDAILMIESSWFKVSVETIINCFSHSTIKSNAGETKLDEINDMNKEINESLHTLKDFFSSEAEMNAYLELDKDIQRTEDFDLECNDPEINDIITDDSTIVIENIKLKDALKSIDVINRFYSFEIPPDGIKSSIYRLMDDLEKRNLSKKKVQLKITDFFNG